MIPLVFKRKAREGRWLDPGPGGKSSLVSRRPVPSDVSVGGPEASLCAWPGTENLQVSLLSPPPRPPANPPWLGSIAVGSEVPVTASGPQAMKGLRGTCIAER